jgi:hypothetical protein
MPWRQAGHGGSISLAAQFNAGATVTISPLLIFGYTRSYLINPTTDFMADNTGERGKRTGAGGFLEKD